MSVLSHPLMYVLVGVEFIRILAILQKMCFETKRKVDKQAGAELGQAKLKLGLGFTSTIDKLVIS